MEKLFIVAFTENGSSVIFEEIEFDYRGQEIPYVFQTWFHSRVYATYTTKCSQKVVRETLF